MWGDPNRAHVSLFVDSVFERAEITNWGESDVDLSGWAFPNEMTSADGPVDLLDECQRVVSRSWISP